MNAGAKGRAEQGLHREKGSEERSVSWLDTLVRVEQGKGSAEVAGLHDPAPANTSATPWPEHAESGPSELYVATDLESWETNRPEPDQDEICERCGYRRLDPTYYAWLRSMMVRARQAHTRAQLPEAEYELLRTRFNAIHAWAMARFGEAGPRIGRSSKGRISRLGRSSGETRACSLTWTRRLKASQWASPSTMARPSRHFCTSLARKSFRHATRAAQSESPARRSGQGSVSSSAWRAAANPAAQGREAKLQKDRRRREKTTRIAACAKWAATAASVG